MSCLQRPVAAVAQELAAQLDEPVRGFHGPAFLHMTRGLEDVRRFHFGNRLAPEHRENLFSNNARTFLA